MTFEEQVVAAEEMARRIDAVGASLPWYLVEREETVIAYAHATPWRVRSGYRFSVESTFWI